MINIIVVIGTRPEAIKLCPIVIELQKNPKFNVIVCHTNQHTDMVDKVYQVFNITPNISIPPLTYNKSNKSLNVLTAHLLTQFDKIIDDIKPQLVMVQGDTNSAFVCGLAAFYKKIKVAHVEAGLRSHDIYNPYPEEFNRISISNLATYHFAPAPQSFDNLLNENDQSLNPLNIKLTGNSISDALFYIKDKLNNKINTFKPILITCHRRENWGEPLTNICKGIKKLCTDYKDKDFIFCVHPNPLVKDEVIGNLKDVDNCRIVDNLPYDQFIGIMINSLFIITDSGGIQEEASILGIPTLVTRLKTERPEGIKAGVLKLVGDDQNLIYDLGSKLMDLDSIEYKKMQNKVVEYGDGTTSVKIRKFLEEQDLESNHNILSKCLIIKD